VGITTFAVVFPGVAGCGGDAIACWVNWLVAAKLAKAKIAGDDILIKINLILVEVSCRKYEYRNQRYDFLTILLSSVF
jgi:hypothetical protein